MIIIKKASEHPEDSGNADTDFGPKGAEPVSEKSMIMTTDGKNNPTYHVASQLRQHFLRVVRRFHLRPDFLDPPVRPDQIPQDCKVCDPHR